MPWHSVQEVVIEHRVQVGCKPRTARLLTWPEDSAKFRKGVTPILGFSGLPHRMAQKDINFCSHSTAGCREFCLNFTGKGALSSVQRGRQWKTNLLIEQPNAWFTLLWHEIELAQKRYDAFRMRLNVFTDVAWEETLPAEFWQHFEQVCFQDYTKQWSRRNTPANYRLVYSASERSPDSAIHQPVETGACVAVVFDWPKGQPFPATWQGVPLVDGDVDDDLWSRPDGCVVGLRAKGRLAKSNSPFKRKVG